MPHLSTELPVWQFLVQENTLFDAEPCRATTSGAGNASFMHHFPPEATFCAEKHSF